MTTCMLANGPARVVERQTFDWNRDGKPDEVVLEATRPPAESGEFEFDRVRIRVSGHAWKTIDDPTGWRGFSGESALAETPLAARNKLRSGRIALVPVEDVKFARQWLFMIRDPQFPNNPFGLSAIRLDKAGVPSNAFDNDSFMLMAIEDLDQDGEPELIGIACLGQGNDDYTTYTPYSVYRGSAAGKAEYDQALSERYTRANYPGWVGSECSSSHIVLHHPEDGGKPVLIPVTGTRYAGPTERTVKVDGPTVIAVMALDHDPDFNSDAEREGYAHMNMALTDIHKCLGDFKVIVHFEFAKKIHLDDRASPAIEFGQDEAHLTGIIFAAPGREPRVVYGTAGSSSLMVMAPAAAAEYFGLPACPPDSP